VSSISRVGHVISRPLAWYFSIPIIARPVGGDTTRSTTETIPCSRRDRLGHSIARWFAIGFLTRSVGRPLRNLLCFSS